MPQLRFRQDRTTQAAMRFLRLRGGRMRHLKLMKLLYLADRAAILKLGRPISFDSYCSMDKGPVLSKTLDLMTEEPDPRFTPTYWGRYISPSDRDYCVTLLTAEVPNDQLSDAEEQIIDEVFAEFGHRNRWDIVEFTHRLPEYDNPEGSSIPFTILDILRGEHWSDEDAQGLIDSLAAEAAMERLSAHA